MNSATTIALLSCFVLVASSPPSVGGQAVFSQDGNTIYALDDRQGAASLEKLKLDSGVVSRVIVPGIPDGSTVTGLARSNAGFLLCLTETALYAWDEQKAEAAAVEVCRVPEGGRFADIAYNPVDSNIALVTRLETADGMPEWALFALFKGQDTAVPVTNRRVESVYAVAFDQDGWLHFGAEGDLWHGGIIGGNPGSGGVLEAYRYAPLATRETSVGNSSQMGVEAVAVAGDRLYVQVSRMGGSGWGRIVRLQRPAPVSSQDGGYAGAFDLGERIRVYLKALQSVEDLGENGVLSAICVSPDEKRVYFRAHRESAPEEKRDWLVTNDGPPLPLAVSRTD